MSYQDRYRRPTPPPLTNLRHLSRDKRYQTTVSIYMDYQSSEWLLLGPVELTRRDSSHHRGVWMLQSFLLNATDFEHDSAKSLRMELIGVELDMLLYGQTIVRGWVKGGDPESFHVPTSSDYDPTKLKNGATKCKLRDCTGHPIVPEGFYIPPTDTDLYNLVAGRKVEISCGVKVKDDE